MTENSQAIAIIGVSAEEIIEERWERKKIVFIASNDRSFMRRSVIWKVDSQKFNENQPGTHFQEHPYSVTMLSPRPEDLIVIKKIGNTSITFYKLWYYDYRYFQNGSKKECRALVERIIGAARDRTIFPAKERVYGFIYSLFRGKRSVRGATEGMLIGMNTPCHDFFHADVDGISAGIGRPIEERFGLEKFSFEYGLASHGYCSVPHDFFKKYPKEMLGAKKFTLEKLCGMVYDLVVIKYGVNNK